MTRIWEIRNSPSVRRNSNDPGRIPFARHAEWMKAKYFTDAGNHCFVYDIDGKAIAYCRFDPVEEKYVVSIAVDPSSHGMGIGSRLLKASIKMLAPQKELLAEVKLDNAVSLRLFQKIGFRITAKDERNYHLSFDP